MPQALCVFCGASPGVRPEYLRAARRYGEGLARRGVTLVYGGGHVGLMGAVADGALAAGGRVIGVITESLMQREVGHAGLTELHVVSTMHDRKKMMADRSDAFVALPGGYGTLEELFEVVTWLQLGYHRKPVGLLDVAGYWQPLLALVQHSIAEGFVSAAQGELLWRDGDADHLTDRLLAAAPARPAQDAGPSDPR